MSNHPPLPRLAEGALTEALSDTPVVLVHGPRQCGKTTLAKQVGERLGFAYLNLDDDAARRAAQDDPAGFVARLPERVIIDEVQRAPEIFLPLKWRSTTGASLVASCSRALPTYSCYQRWLTRSLAVWARSDFTRSRSANWNGGSQRSCGRSCEAISRCVLLGVLERKLPHVSPAGLSAALARKAPARRKQWYADYVDSLVQRDVRDLARIGSLNSIPKLLKLAASQTARLINVSELAARFKSLDRRSATTSRCSSVSSFWKSCRHGTATASSGW